MTDLLATSPDTWRDRSREEPVVPPELFPPIGAGPRERWRTLWERHDLRRQRAEDTYDASRNPVRGWPVSGNRAVLHFFRDLVRRRRGVVVAVLVLNGLAAAAGLVVPRLLGELVNGTVEPGSGPGLDTLALLVVGVVITQAGLTFLAQRTSTLFGQDLLSGAREYVVRVILRLPLGAVESASTGDLVTRVTRDVGTMSRSVQYALPMMVISLVTVVLSIGAMLLNSVVLAVPALLVFATCSWAVRGYLRRAPKGYITEGATYSRINTTLTETVEGARTLESLGLSGLRVRAGNGDIEVSAQAERYGMTLRNILFLALNFAFQAPRVITLVVGAYAYSQGWVDLGQITTAVLYSEALAEPLDRLIGEVDRLQVGAASTSRLLGIAEVPADRKAGEKLPDGADLEGADLRFAYRPGHDVLHGIDLSLRQGERLAVVGPSGSGKSTLGRLLSGINRPRTGRATVGGVDLVDLPLEVLRTEVALVTQEHHVFIGSVRDNIVLARENSGDGAVREALRAVGSLDWVERLPRGLDTVIGSGRHALTPAQAQQVALARLIIADPHTLVLDEATSLIDPRTARTLEGSMNSLLEGRTVVAIAHRLHTAHDADRIAVVIDGRVVELGSHHELVDLDGEYAALWRAWTS
ncbi:MAG: ABC transporter ATP-binding protein/permease [Frankiaceae bacterium]|nr:ABC transporter ATP-binding protein/permease [Frankiaceae bacterium]